MFFAGLESQRFSLELTQRAVCGHVFPGQEEEGSTFFVSRIQSDCSGQGVALPFEMFVATLAMLNSFLSILSSPFLWPDIPTQQFAG